MKTLRIFQNLLSRRSDSLYLFALSVLAGLLSGASTSGLIALVHRIIKAENIPVSHPFLAFLGLWIGHGAFGVLSTITAARMVHGILFDLRMSLSRQVMSTPLKTIEEIGESKLIAMFLHVIDTIAASVESLPGLVSRTAMLIGLFAYMAWLSPVLFLAFLAFLVLGVGTYLLPLSVYKNNLKRQWEAYHTHVSHFYALVKGIKELLQNRSKKYALMHRHLRPSGERLMGITIRSLTLDTIVNRWGEMYALLGLAFILFFLTGWGMVSLDEVSDFLLILLFALGPLVSVINFLFKFQHLKVALQELETTGMRLEQASASWDAPMDGVLNPSMPGTLSIGCREILYAYHHEERNEQFTLGPISLTVDSPQIVFITGGNGSGKSTLAKVLCGLYTPESGDISCNGCRIDDHNREAYRQLFSVVLFDFYLFDTLLGLEDRDVDRQANEYAARLRLSHKVSIHDHRFSTVQLSQGQRRRLALLHAHLEDRPAYLFDEWAADQDATFKAVFYREILPALKQAGKLVFVVTHDESFFHIADRIIKLTDGQATEIAVPETADASPP